MFKNLFNRKENAIILKEKPYKKLVSAAKETYLTGFERSFNISDSSQKNSLIIKNLEPINSQATVKFVEENSERGVICSSGAGDIHTHPLLPISIKYLYVPLEERQPVIPVKDIIARELDSVVSFSIQDQTYFANSLRDIMGVVYYLGGNNIGMKCYKKECSDILPVYRELKGKLIEIPSRISEDSLRTYFDINKIGENKQVPVVTQGTAICEYGTNKESIDDYEILKEPGKSYIMYLPLVKDKNDKILESPFLKYYSDFLLYR